jgi:nucleotide-binding universal stress UspA family protein
MRASTAVPVEEVIREGKTVEEILKQIDEDEDIAILVLGASIEGCGTRAAGLVLAAGATAGKFPIPITIVPGELRSTTSRRWPDRWP